MRYLPNAKKVGKNEYAVLCPFHNDTKPSLNFNNQTGEYYCHGCEEGGDFINFYAKFKGLNAKRDFKKILANIASEFGIAPEKPQIVATYDYCDEKGELLYQVCRLEPKNFRIRKPSKNGGWEWNLNGTRRVLYRLPEILKAQDVIIVEGEKDADNLAALGFCSTTCPLGAGKWQQEYSEYLRGKDVILLPDNDEPGRKHMEQVGNSLNGFAKTIKWLELPDLPEKGDVTDFIFQCATKEEATEQLLIMLESAPLYEPQSVNSSDPLAFPSDIIDGVAGDFARIYARHLEAPEHFFFLAFLTCLGSVLSGRLTLNSELWPQPRLFVLLLGESADDRKSTAIDKTIEFFEDTLTDFKVSRGVGSAEGLQKRLEENNHLLLCFDEFKQFVSKCKIETSVLLPCVTTLFESNRYEARTKATDISLKDAHLSLLAASTVQTYQYTWDNSFTDIGFNNRLFIVPGKAEPRFAVPKIIPQDEKEYLKDCLQEILHAVGEKLVLNLTDNANALYHNWYMNREHSVHSKRLDTYALRFMNLLAINELKKEVDEEIIEKVIQLMNWQLEMRKLYDPIDADSNIAKMEERIRRVLRISPKTERELKRETHAHRAGLWTFEQAKKNLLRSQEIAWERSTRRWKIL